MKLKLTMNWTVSAILLIIALIGAIENSQGAEFKLIGDWTIEVKEGAQVKKLSIDQPEYNTVTDEKYSSVALFKPKGSPWNRGERLKGVIAYECTIADAIVPGSVKVRLTKGTGEYLKPGTDYMLDEKNGNFGRIEGKGIPANTKAYVSYSNVMMRLDSIIRQADGSLSVVRGQSHASTPAPADLLKGQVRIAVIWINGRIDKLTQDNIFPIESGEEDLSHARRSPAGIEPVAKKLVPKSWKKLVRGEKIRILAWGDSVTDAGYLPKQDRWQSQLVAQLQKEFPNAKIELITEAWGGRNSDSYRNEPAGSPKNYKEKVLALKPDLIVSEFVNDSGMNEVRVAKRYGEMLADFRAIGAEWIICTPHYVRPAWMNLTSLKNIDEDPRAYTKGLRIFAEKNGIALADASRSYGRLWRKGIPYIVLMTNNINHPNKYGMSIFADNIANLFR